MRHLLIFVFLVAVLYAENQIKKVSLQLPWLDQFQFAGYYMAIEKGFYKDVGLALTIKPFNKERNNFYDVINRKVDYSIGDSSLIYRDSKGKKISLLSALLQSSPFVVLALKSSHITSVEDFKGKSIMQFGDLLEQVSLNAMLNAHKLSLASVKIVPHSFNIESLLNKDVDLFTGYLSNEPYILQQKGIKFTSFSHRTEGINMFGDILYTSQKYAKQSTDEVKRFKKASLEGWKYAFNHIDETINVILKKYNTQNKTKKSLKYEANVLRKLAYTRGMKLGAISEEKIQRIYDIYKILGSTQTSLDIESLLFANHKFHFSKKEKKYLQNKQTIRFCAQPNSLPYSAIQNGKFIGIGANIIDLIADRSGIDFELIPAKTWKESKRKAINRECEILPLSSDAPLWRKYFNFTSSYYEEPLVLVTQKEEPYILSIESVLDKKFVAMKALSFISNLQEKYPNIQIEDVQSPKEGLERVESGECYAYIDVLMSAAYTMQKNSKFTLKIAAQFDEGVKVSFAVRNDDAILLGIMQKVVKSIEKEELQNIINKWISINYTQGVSYWYFKEISIAVLLFIIFMLYREYFLKKKNEELEYLQKKLLNLNDTLESRILATTYDLEQAQKVAKIGFWVYDIVADHLEWSHNTYTMFGVAKNKDENLYNALFEKTHPEDRTRVKEAYYKSIEEHTLYEIEHRIILDDGSIKYIRERGETRYKSDGTPLITYGTSQDITEKILLDIEIKRKNSFLLHQSRLAQMGEMLSMIAHQWKQPLSAISATQITIKTTIELQKYDLSNEDERETFIRFLQERLDKIALYVANLGKTIQDFSDFYRPNKLAQKNSIDALILKAFELVRDSFDASLIETHFNLLASEEIFLHENEFVQVLLNIMQNAKDQLLEKNIEQAKIYIKSYVEDTMIVVEIADNAGGVDEELLDKIFDPYFSTKLEKNGTGLGLYMCKLIIEEYHEGSIYVENTAEGACFRVKIKKDREQNEVYE